LRETSGTGHIIVSYSIASIIYPYLHNYRIINIESDYECIYMYLIYNVCFPGSLQKSVVSSYHPLVRREMKRERKAEANARVEDSIGQERPAGSGSQLRSGTTGESLVKCSSILQALAING
jgi:hypothetical protein